MVVSLRKVLTHGRTNFRSHQYSVTVPGRLQPPANDLFGNTSRIVRSPYRVTICRVDQISARIHIRTEDSVRRCLIGAPAELHGSKSDRGDKKPRIPELAIANFYIHSYTLILRVRAKSRTENGQMQLLLRSICSSRSIPSYLPYFCFFAGSGSRRHPMLRVCHIQKLAS